MRRMAPVTRAKNRLLLWLNMLLLCAAICLPLIVRSGYIIRILSLIWLYSILALSLNLITGFTGLLSLGHAAFYCIGAYTSALLALKLHWPFIWCLFAAGAMALTFGIAVGIPALRLKMDYLCIVTMGFAEIVRIVFQNWMSLTRGPMGLPGIPRPVIFGFEFTANVHFYYLFLAFLVLVLWVVTGVVDSQIGRALIAIREDEVAAQCSGVDITYYKVMAFALGAGMAGVAGSLMAGYTSYICPSNFTVDESLLILQMVILGGLGSIPGSVVGAAILVSVAEAFRVVSQYRMLLSGIVMVALMVARPQGLLGTVKVTELKFFRALLPKAEGSPEGGRAMSVGR